jgi:hypothetical protein
VLWGFNISHDIDEMGRKGEVDINAYAGAEFAEPAVIRAKIEPRSAEHAGMMKLDFGTI